MAHVMV